MFCKNCGAQLEETSSFCGDCGTKVEAFESKGETVVENKIEPPQKTSPKKNKKIGLFIGLTAFLLILIAGGIFTYFKYFSPEAQFDKYLELGQKYLLEENYEQAIIAFEKAIQIDGKNIEAYMGLSDAYIGNDENDKAEETLMKVIDLDPKGKDAYLKLADLYIESEDLEKAADILEEGSKQTDDRSIKKKAEQLKEEMKPKIVPFEVEEVLNYSIEVPGASAYDGYKITFSIPQVKSSVPNAQKINNKLKENTNTYLDAYQEFKNNDFSMMEEYDIGVWEANYEVYQYKTYYALAFHEFSGAPYSGAGEYTTVVYYDAALGDTITASEYAAKCGYTESEVIAKSCEDDLGYATSIDNVPFVVDSTGKLEVFINGSM